MTTENSLATGATKISRDPLTRELTIERVVNASRELAWEGWTRPEHIERWWGPKEWTTTVYTMDVRPGGVWHYCMRARYDESQKVWGRAVFEDVVEPSLLSYTEAFADPSGNPVDDRQRRTSVEF